VVGDASNEDLPVAGPEVASLKEDAVSAMDPDRRLILA
jgi:hypothetical protein